MLESIDEIYKYGILEFKIDNDFSYCIYVGEDNKLRLMKKNDKLTVFSEENEKEFVNALSYIVYGSFSNNIDFKFCSSDNHVRGGRYEKSRLCNAIGACYVTMMDDAFFEMYRENDNIQSIMRQVGSFTTLDEIHEFIDFETIEYIIKDCSYRFYEKLISSPSYVSQDKALRNKQLDSYGEILDSYQLTNKPDIEVEIEEEKKVVPNIKTSRRVDTSILDKNSISYVNLTDKKYITNPAVGRDKEIRKLGSTLLSPLLSPILLGEAGVGKTAIVQGIAYAIKNNNISKKLLDKKIIEITPNSLVSGTRYRGDFEQRVEVLIKFLRENPDVILYLDEFQATKKLGSSEDSGNDFMNSLKPYIGNGETKIIGATTKDEYKEFIATDKAFARRFKDIIVEEPDNRLLKLILDSNIEKFENQTGIRFGSNDLIREEMINYLIDITNYTYRMSDDIKYNPALALSIISEAYGYAAYDLKSSVNPDYLVEASRECNSLMQESIKPKTKSLFLKSVIADSFSE